MCIPYYQIRCGATDSGRTMRLPDSGGSEQISLVGERHNRRLAKNNVGEYNASETHEHRRHPAGQRMLAWQHLCVWSQSHTTQLTINTLVQCACLHRCLRHRAPKYLADCCLRASSLSKVIGRQHLRMNIPRFCRSIFCDWAFSCSCRSDGLAFTGRFVAWSGRRVWTF